MGLMIEVIRTGRRKTAEIRVDEGSVSIRVPMRTSMGRIDELLHTKGEWILKKLSRQEHILPVEPRAYVSGEEFCYLGSGYRLEVQCGPFAPVKMFHGCLRVRVPGGSTHPHLVRNALVRWYKQRAYDKLNQMVEQVSHQVGVLPAKVEVRNFKARWGSCSSTGVVQFNWRIMLAPARMVEYVVVHELCHLLQHNHSKAYWREVERVMPDYRECREWFKSHGWSLHV